MTEWKSLEGYGPKTYKLDGRKIVIPSGSPIQTFKEGITSLGDVVGFNKTLETLGESSDMWPAFYWKHGLSNMRTSEEFSPVPGSDGNWSMWDTDQPSPQSHGAGYIRPFLGLTWQSHTAVSNDSEIPGMYRELTYGKRLEDELGPMHPEIWGIWKTSPIEIETDTSQFGKWEQKIKVRVKMGNTEPLSAPYYLALIATNVLAGKPGEKDVNALPAPPDEIVDWTSKSAVLDHVFFIDRPSVNRLEKLSSNSTATAFVEPTPSYNYYLCKYEEEMDQDLSEHLLPNVYNIASISKWNADPDSPPPEFVKAHQRYGKSTSPHLTEDDLGLHNLDRYLREWPEAVSKDPFTPEQEKLHSHVLFPPSAHSFFESVKEYADKFPMHVKLSFSATPGTEFVDILNQANFFKPLVKNIFAIQVQLGELVKSMDGANTAQLNLMLQSVDKFWDSKQAGGQGAYVSDWLTHDLKSAPMQYFDLSQWFEGMTEVSTAADFKDFIYPYAADLDSGLANLDINLNLASKSVTPLSIFEKEEDADESVLLQTLFFNIAQKEINEYAKKHMRTYEQILKGEPAHNETIMYELVKLDQDLNKIQTIYLPQRTGIIEYFDTQVKYGENYTYQVYAHQVVVGTKFSISGLNEKNAPLYFFEPGKSWDPQYFKYKVVYEPNIKIFRVPYYNTEDYQWKRLVMVTDSAPLPPEITFYPLAGEKNKVTLALNTSIGHRKMEPIFLSSEESANFGNSPALQKQFSLHDDGLYGYGHLITKYVKGKTGQALEPVTSATVGDLFADKSQNDPSREFVYSSDDTGGTFEIYRMDERPGLYTDFEPLSKTLVAKMDSRKQSAFTDENIQPNRKYYYTCRLRDPHGNLSNPTPVYEVELIDTGLGIFPSIKIVELKGTKKAETEPTSPFRRFLLIRPNYIQDLIEGLTPSGEPIEEAWDTAEEAADKIEIGQAETSVFNKKFKARITSKRTGRKLDFNFKVKTSTRKLVVKEPKEKC